MTGSMRAARRAEERGEQPDRAEHRERYGIGKRVARIDAEHERTEDSRRGPGRGKAEGGTRKKEPARAERYGPYHPAGGGAERQANADLARLLGYDRGRHAVDPRHADHAVEGLSTLSLS
jgi:hypothetical protein